MYMTVFQHGKNCNYIQKVFYVTHSTNWSAYSMMYLLYISGRYTVCKVTLRNQYQHIVYIVHIFVLT